MCAGPIGLHLLDIAVHIADRQHAQIGHERNRGTCDGIHQRFQIMRPGEDCTGLGQEGTSPGGLLRCGTPGMFLGLRGAKAAHLVQFNEHLHLGLEDLRHHRGGNVIHRTAGVTLGHAHFIGESGEEDDRRGG